MFTGIVVGQGQIAEIESVETGCRLVVELPGPPHAWDREIAAGDSIAVDGCCLTAVAAPESGRVAFDVIHQTLRCTTTGALEVGSTVNLEAAALPTTALGGHIVQGHVDGVAEVTAVVDAGGEYRLRLRVDAELRPYITAKGSVTLAGVSLTVAEISSDAFEVALIPTTLDMTTLGRAAVGTQINLETDYVAKIVVGYLRTAGLPAVDA